LFENVIGIYAKLGTFDKVKGKV